MKIQLTRFASYFEKKDISNVEVELSIEHIIPICDKFRTITNVRLGQWRALL